MPLAETSSSAKKTRRVILPLISESKGRVWAWGHQETTSEEKLSQDGVEISVAPRRENHDAGGLGLTDSRTNRTRIGSLGGAILGGV